MPKNMSSPLVAMDVGSMINGSPPEGESGGVGLLFLFEDEADSWKSISSAVANWSKGLEYSSHGEEAAKLLKLS